MTPADEKVRSATHWRRVFALTVFGALMLTALAFANSGRAAIETPPPPSVWSDKADYAPGEQVTLSGANWAPGESVHIRVNDDASETWRRDVDVAADESGAISDQFNLPDWFVAQYTVTATGASSGTATWSFTDSNPSAIVLTPSSATAVQGSSASYTVSLTVGGNTNQCNVTLAAGVLPAGAIASFGTNPLVTTGSGNSPVTTTLTVATDTTTPTGSFTINVSGTNGAGCQGPGPTAGSATLVVTPGDTTAPTVSSVNRLDASPSNTTGNVRWTVTFNENVTGVESTDFALANTGLGGPPVISSVIGSGSSYTVTSSSGTGSGTLGLNLVDDDSIVDGAGNKLGGTGTGNGNFTGQVYTIDRTAPTVTASAVTLPGSAPYAATTWTNKDVRVAFTCSDSGGSGLTSGSGNQTQDFTAETSGATATFSGTCADNAGTTASGATFTPIKIDKTTPVISGSAVKGDSPSFTGATAYTADTWTNKDVRVSFTCADALSGVDTDTVAGSDLTANTPVGGTNVNSTGSCTDQAGNAADAGSFGPVKIDKTKPTITFNGQSPTQNGQGWNNTNVTLSWSCTDTLSGPQNASDSKTISTEGSHQQDTGTCTDNAGNSASSTDGDVSIDKTKPVVSVTGVSDGATYTLGSVPAAGCSTTDPLSGVKMAATLSSSGGPVGSITASCNGAEDKAGNTNSASATYNVNFNFTGFFAPVDNSPVCNTAKAGSAIPVKFTLHGNQGMNIFAPGYPKATTGTCSTSNTDAIEETSTASQSGLNYDATADQYIYVWKTDKAWGGKAILLTVRLADGTDHTARFSFTK